MGTHRTPHPNIWGRSRRVQEHKGNPKSARANRDLATVLVPFVPNARADFFENGHRANGRWTAPVADKSAALKSCRIGARHLFKEWCQLFTNPIGGVRPANQNVIRRLNGHEEDVAGYRRRNGLLRGDQLVPHIVE